MALSLQQRTPINVKNLNLSGTVRKVKLYRLSLLEILYRSQGNPFRGAAENISPGQNLLRRFGL